MTSDVDLQNWILKSQLFPHGVEYRDNNTSLLMSILILREVFWFQIFSSFHYLVLQSLNNFGKLIFSRTFHDLQDEKLVEVYAIVMHEINCISVELRNAIIHLDLNKNKTKQNLPLYVFSKPQKSYFSGNMIASYYILLIIISRDLASSWLTNYYSTLRKILKAF